MGPHYCETPALLGGFPAEPVNAYSNLVIIAFALVALFLIHRRKGSAPDLYALGIFLLATGIGSFLWHSLRSSWALLFDVLPGIVFLILFVYGWGRRLFGIWQSALIAAGLFVGIGLVSAIIAVSTVAKSMIPFFAGPVLVSIFFGVWLSVFSWKRKGPVTVLALGGIFAAVLAFLFRTLDLYSCEYISFGTHFLWHVFLSLGAFLCIRFLLSADEKSV